MKIKLNNAFITFFVSAILLAGAIETLAQADTTPKKRLTSPATVQGYIGGEAHDSYVIRAIKGQTMTVQITWRRKDTNRAEFSVSRSANFYNGAVVKFGKESDNGRRWRGKIPKTGNYYIYVVANPAAKYTLKVTVK